MNKSVHVFPYKIPIKLKGTKININDEVYETGQVCDDRQLGASIKAKDGKRILPLNFTALSILSW